MSGLDHSRASLIELQHAILSRIRADLDRLELCASAFDALGQAVPEYDPDSLKCALMRTRSAQ